jgi:hypothetical protein
MSDEGKEKSLIIKKVIFTKKKLDKEIGYNYWKRYIASVFWSQISTPINLAITILTAITTAQIQTNDFVSPSASSNLAVISLILATLNTFFRPHVQYATNTEFLSKWVVLGVKFEDEYYNNRIEGKTIGDYLKRLESLQAIQKSVNELRQLEGTNSINFLTDFIFYISFLTCLRNNKNWLDSDKTVDDAVKQRLQENSGKTGGKMDDKPDTKTPDEQNIIIQPVPLEVKIDIENQPNLSLIKNI